MTELGSPETELVKDLVSIITSFPTRRPAALRCVCGSPITKWSKTGRCRPCALKAWHESPEGKEHTRAMGKARNESLEGKEHTRAMGKAWYESPEGKKQVRAMSKAWNESEEGKVQVKAWNKSEEGKAQVKAMTKAWHESEEGKAQVKAMAKAWHESEEGKAQVKALQNIKASKFETVSVKAVLDEFGVRYEPRRTCGFGDVMSENRSRLSMTSARDAYFAACGAKQFIVYEHDGSGFEALRVFLRASRKKSVGKK